MRVYYLGDVDLIGAEERIASAPDSAAIPDQAEGVGQAHLGRVLGGVAATVLRVRARHNNRVPTAADGKVVGERVLKRPESSI